MSQLVNYGGFELDDVQDQEQQTEEEGFSEFMKLLEGANLVRFLPPLPAQKPILVSYEHYLELPNGSKIRFACDRMLNKRPCRACDRHIELKRSQNPVDRDASWRLRAKRRVYANVIDRDDEEAGVKVLGFGVTVHDPLLDIRKADGDFTDPTVNGFDIRIHRKGTNQYDTEYTVRPARDSTPLHVDPAVANQWIADQYDLSTYIRLASIEDIEAWLDGRDTRSRRGADTSRQVEAGERGRGRGRGGRAAEPERGERPMRDAKPKPERRRTAASDMIPDDHEDPQDADDHDGGGPTDAW